MRFVGSAALALLLSCGQVLAGASSANLPMPAPDPATKTMSRYEAKLYVFDRCLISQSRLMGTTREAVHSPCSCYSTKTIDGMSKAEFQYFKDNSVFDDATRPKALANIDACKLKRPS
jgi:hypothetical protein